VAARNGSGAGQEPDAIVPPTTARTPRYTIIGSGEPWSTSQLVLAVGNVLGVVEFALCLGRAGGTAGFWSVGAAALLAGVLTPLRDRQAPFAFWGALLIWWVATVPGPFSWWALPGAVALLGSHCCLALSAIGPQDLHLSRSVVTRLARRAAVVVAISAAVATGCSAITARELPGYPLVMTAGLLLLAGWTWLNRTGNAHL